MSKTIKGIKVSDAQAAVYGVFRSLRRPLADQALVPLAQHQLKVHQSSSGIRTRRAELVSKKLLVESKPTTTGSGRPAKTYKVA